MKWIDEVGEFVSNQIKLSQTRVVKWPEGHLHEGQPRFFYNGTDLTPIKPLLSPFESGVEERGSFYTSQCLIDWITDLGVTGGAFFVTSDAIVFKCVDNEGPRRSSRLVEGRLCLGRTQDSLDVEEAERAKSHDAFYKSLRRIEHAVTPKGAVSVLGVIHNSKSVDTESEAGGAVHSVVFRSSAKDKAGTELQIPRRLDVKIRPYLELDLTTVRQYELEIQNKDNLEFRLTLRNGLDLEHRSLLALKEWAAGFIDGVPAYIGQASQVLRVPHGGGREGSDA